jgi:hypothetical protein
LTVTYTTVADTTFVNCGIKFVLSCTAYIDNSMLVVGSVAADYAPLHPADDLARCMRYYEGIGNQTQNVAFGGYNAAAGISYWPLHYSARKPVTPTVTIAGAWGLSNCTKPSLWGASGVDGFTVQVVATGTGAFITYNNGSTDAILVEANP